MSAGAYLNKADGRKTWNIVWEDKDGKKGSFSTKLKKVPPGTPRDQVKEASASQERLAQEIADKLNQRLKGDLEAEEFEADIHNLAVRATRCNSTTTTATFLISWAWEYSFRHGLDETVVGRICKVFRDFLDQVGNKAQEAIRKIKKPDIQDFLDNRVSSDYAGATVNTQRDILLAAFEDAKTAGHLGVNPARKTAELPTDTEERLPFSSEELLVLLKTMRNWGEIGREWRTVTLLTAYTSMRFDDACKFLRGNIDLDNGTITFRASKTQRHRKPPETKPLHPRLWHHLRSFSAMAPNEYLNPTLANRSPSSRSTSFNRLMDAAEVDRMRIKREDRRKRFSKRSFYALRHTVNYWLKAAGVDREMRKEVLCQLTDEAHEYYEHEYVDGMRKVIGLLPDLDDDEPSANDGAINYVI